VYDLAGRVVRDFGTATSRELSWDTSGVGAGVYFVRVAHGGTSVTKKVSVVR
ncbi:T9SS type A sorting domain-containing protein, partial [bacterium]|nr:T9SS type A sorting domain-containing protein [bacterium]